MLPLFKVFMSKDIDTSLLEVLHSGYITQGKKVEEFENSLKKWFDYPYILTLNSATSGLTLGLRLLDLEYGDEVLCSPLTCLATNLPVLANNLRIKWVDIDPETCNIDLQDLERKITYKTKAILFVHWGGSPLNMKELDTVLDKAERKFGYRLKVIEDCAHSFGAEYEGNRLGTLGNISVFSLQAIKQLTTGDGGLIFLPNRELYERAKLLRWYGIDREKRSNPGKDFRLEGNVPEWGYKFHMNDINATIGLANLPHIQRLLNIARQNGAYYGEQFKDLPGIELLKPDPNSVSSYWIYTMKVADKPSFINFMNDKNVMISQVHNRNDCHSCLAEFKTHLPQLDELEKHIISIPVGWWITPQDCEYIVESVKKWSNMFCKIRKLTLEDMEQYLLLIHQLTGVKSDEKKISQRFNDIASPPQHIYVVENKNNIVATGKIFIEPKLGDNVGHIEDVVVDENYRGKGYGKEIVKVLVSVGRENKCYKTVINCKEGLEPFYKKCGLKKEGSEMTFRY